MKKQLSSELQKLDLMNEGLKNITQLFSANFSPSSKEGSNMIDLQVENQQLKEEVMRYKNLLKEVLHNLDDISSDLDNLKIIEQQVK